MAQPAAAHGWIARHGWLMAAVWLVFLAFPVLTVVSDDTGRPTKIAAIALMALFSVVYVDGFRRQGERESQALSDTNRLSYDWVADGSSGAAHFAVMIALAVVTYAVAGHAALGMTPYVVALAVFHFTWPMAWAVAVAGVVVNLAVPAATGDLDVLWFYAIIAASVGASTLLIRAVETNQFEQAQLRTRLALSDERGRVARDVHDVLGHSLTAMILKTELCRRLLDGVEAEDQAQRARLDACRAQLEELESVGRSALAEIRSTVGGLRAADLADELTVARSVLGDAGVELGVVGTPGDVDERMRSVAGWVVREAVTNVVRHARASRCVIELRPSEVVVLRITDDGVGLGESARGNGLRGLDERVASYGAELRVAPAQPGDGSLDGHGTKIEVLR
ncbi:MAG: histidine kinase [Acidimicrobiales bacterium]